MIKKNASKIINHFELSPEIVSIEGTFRYRYFEPFEQIEQDSRFVKDENLPDVPRYNTISWKGNRSIVFINMDGFEEDLIHRESLYYASDLQVGFTSYTIDQLDTEQQMTNKVSDNSNQSSRLDYLLTQVASSVATEAIEENINKIKSQVPVLDNTTNRPIVMTTNTSPVQSPDFSIDNERIYDVLLASSKSPFSSDRLANDITIAKEVSTKEQAATEELEGSNRYITNISYLMRHPKLKMPTIPRLNPDFLVSFELIGYLVTKFLIKDGGELEYQYTRFARERNYKDVYIAYGKTYRYEIRPVFARYTEPDNLLNENVMFVCSDESSFIDIQTIEEKAPSPPRNVRFEYILNERIQITWERPSSYVADISDSFGNAEPPTSKLYDTDDIKGYQLFVRNSLQEPYKLLNYFTFNNTHPPELRIRPAEIIPDELVISSEYTTTGRENPFPRFDEPRKFIVSIRPNVDYYFAMCSIDAHGNSSQYSSQYKIRRNNVTGEVSIEMVSQEGAPKQYPNLLVPTKLVRPSFTVSGYQFMDVYYAPDTEISKPSIDTPGVNIQLFELETQVEKNIKITLSNKETRKTSN